MSSLSTSTFQRHSSPLLTQTSVASSGIMLHDPLGKKEQDLPEEVVCDIFLLLTEDEFFAAPHLRRMPLYPWILAQVCSRWRYICLQNPKLWTYLSWKEHWLHCSTKAGHNPASLQRTYLQLERSKNSTLAIDASTLCDCACQISRFKAVVKHSHRWRLAIFDTSYCPMEIGYMQSLIPRSRHKFTSLKEIKWSCDGDFDEGMDVFRSWIGNGAEIGNLETVTFNLADIPMLEGVFPWEQLKALILHNFTCNLDELLDLLSSCSNLTRLKLFDDLSCHLQPYGMASTTTNIVTLAQLTSLDIDICSPVDMTLFLSRIQAPNLRSLFFAHYTSSIPFDSIDMFVDFLSTNSLTKLEICYPSEYESRYLDIFKALDQVQELTLSALYESDKRGACCDGLLADMAEEGSAILPQLRHIQLHHLKFDPALVTQFVIPRLRHTGDGSAAYIAPASGSPLLSLTIKEDELNSSSVQDDKAILETSLEKYTLSGALRLRFINN